MLQRLSLYSTSFCCTLRAAMVQELADTVALAMTKNKTLCSMALALLQKLLLNKALSADGRWACIETLQELSVGRAHDDESTRLKLLQTCLSFLQLPGTADRPEESRKVCWEAPLRTHWHCFTPQRMRALHTICRGEAMYNIFRAQDLGLPATSSV